MFSKGFPEFSASFPKVCKRFLVATMKMIAGICVVKGYIWSGWVKGALPEKKVVPG
jgi:hypothetical protein